MKRVVAVEEAVGMVLPHDITEIIKDEFKGCAFKKGHVIKCEDVEHLRRLGKEHIFVLQLSGEEIHENEAALLMANALAGPGTEFSPQVMEGKVAIRAAVDGLLKINQELLLRFNLLGEVMCATLQNNTPVQRGEQVAATRLIPLVATRQLVERAVAVAGSAGEPILSVVPLRRVRAGLVITGNEIFHGRIEDRFEQVLRDKLSLLGSEVSVVEFAPDDPRRIAAAIRNCLDCGAELIVTSGGMSVDPDDVTRQGIREAGVEAIVYGTPVLPGAMFLVGQLGTVPVFGLPACGMFHKITVFDLVLPRILTGESIDRAELAALGHGGLCRNCTPCRYPVCSFGKA
ncbi:molybdopterin-binding protein [Desulfobulbus alkaliphilus]|uniref:molybdopterin-binding protein n=1 Tax=Desulfobulbus alkaliphilus TaxID=869814 RepID=UPI00196529B4|nr:molybdopterin-binding protein [Desulfobulbus alkaliphilus]MBM9536058.1 molybdopterin-binding protein [Desulfobulbus alkaliphilus]